MDVNKLPPLPNGKARPFSRAGHLLLEPAALLRTPPELAAQPPVEPWKAPPPPAVQPHVLIDQREEMIARLRSFALRWYRAAQDPFGYQPGRTGPIHPLEQKLDSSSRSCWSARSRSTISGGERRGMTPKALSRSPLAASMPEQPQVLRVSTPVAATHRAPTRRPQQPHAPKLSPRPARTPSPKSKQATLVVPSPSARAIRDVATLSFDAAQQAIAQMLAEIAEVTLLIVEGLKPPPFIPPPRRRTAAATANGSAPTQQQSAISGRWLEWLLLPTDRAAADGAAVLIAGLGKGVHYLLQVLVDFHRLPTPSATDPFMLRWFDEMDHPYMLPSEQHSEETIARMNSAELAMRSMLPTTHLYALRRAQGSPVGRSDEAWRALAYLMYGETGGYIVRQREIWARDQAALRLALWIRKGRMNIRIAERRKARRDDAARTIQKYYRGRNEGLFGMSSAVANLTLEARKEAKRQQRLREEREIEERREERRREARRQLLEKRRRALLSALPAARKFYSAHSAVSGSWRTALAKRFLSRVRRANASASVVSSYATNGAATIWQARYRSWAQRGLIVAAQGALCAASSDTDATERRRESLYKALPEVRSAAQTRADEARSRATAAREAADTAELHLHRELLRAEGRLSFLRECEGCAASSQAGVHVNSSAIDRALIRLEEKLVAASAATDSFAEPRNRPNVRSRKRTSFSDDAMTAEAVQSPGRLLGAKDATAAASSSFAELEAATMRHRSVRERMLKLAGGAAVAARLVAEHTGAVELLIGVEAHLLRASDSWEAQLDESEQQVAGLRDAWKMHEQLSAAHQFSAALRVEIELSADSAESPPASPTGRRSSMDGGAAVEGARRQRRGSDTGRRSRRTSALGAMFAEVKAVNKVWPPESFAAALSEAEQLEKNARAKHETTCSEEAKKEWLEAISDRARANGELAVLGTLSAAHGTWDRHCNAIRLRGLRSSRLASAAAKLHHRRAQQRAAQALGAQRVVRSLLDAQTEAQRNSRAFSARSALRDGKTAADARLASAKQALNKELLAKRNRSARERAQRKARSHLPFASGGQQQSGLRIGMAGGGGGGGAAIQAQAAAAAAAAAASDLPRPSAEPSPTAGRRGSVADKRAKSSRASQAEAPAAVEEAEDIFDGTAVKMRREVVSASQGEAAAFARLCALLPPALERMPNDWLAVHGEQLIAQLKVEEEEARGEEGMHAKLLQERAAAKEALRAQARAGLKKAIGKVGLMVRLGAKGFDAKGVAAAAASAVQGANGGGASSGSGGGGGARESNIAAAADSFDEGALAGRLEAERVWEQQHVMMSLCKAGATCLAELGRGPADPRLHGTWGAVQASVQMRDQGWLREPTQRITLAHFVNAAQTLGLQLIADGGDLPLAWLALELLRAPLPDGWVAHAPAMRDAMPRYESVADDAGGEAKKDAVQDEHPLLSTIVEEADIMRRRLRLRWRMHRPLEAHWLFATPEDQWNNGKGPAGVWTDLLTNKTNTSFPAHVLQRSAPPPQPSASTAGGTSKSLIAVIRAKQQEERLLAQQQAQQARRAALAATVAAAEEQTRALRRDALRTRPRCGVELMHAARALHIDLVAQPELAFLAELALCLALPAGWVLDPPPPSGGAPRYRNLVSGIVSTTHPLAAYAAGFRM